MDCYSTSSSSSSRRTCRRFRRLRRRPVLSLVLMPLTWGVWWRPNGTTLNNDMEAMAYPCVPVEPQQQQQDNDDNCVCQYDDEALVALDFNVVGQTDGDLDWRIEDVTNATTTNNIVVVTSCKVVTQIRQCEIGYYNKNRQLYCLPKNDRCYRLVVQSSRRSAVVTGSFDGIVFLVPSRADKTSSVYFDGGGDSGIDIGGGGDNITYNNASDSSPSGVCRDQRPSLPPPLAWATLTPPPTVYRAVYSPPQPPVYNPPPSPVGPPTARYGDNDGNDDNGHWSWTVLVILVGLAVGYCCLGRVLTWCWCAMFDW